MALKRPTSLLVFGILHIVFGSAGLLCGIVGAVLLLTGFQKNMQQMQNPPAGAGNAQQKELLEYQEHALTAQTNTPYYNEHLIASQAASIFLCILLIVAGIGLIKMASWGRILSLVYGVLSVLSTILGLLYSLCIQLPAMNAFLEQEKATATAGSPVQTIIAVTQPMMYVEPCFMLFYFIYPALVLFWMLRPSIAEACRKGGIEVPDDKRYPPDLDTGVEYRDRGWGDRSGQTTEEYTPDKPRRSDMTTEEFYPDKPPS